MLSSPPSYFESVRQKASSRWDQLEGDPDLAGPWHQLFKQVQSPRHVVSELLQNADDAFATEASISICDGVFRFEHNGEDFLPEHFESLCRFGYSNKRALHTIGFRGIGFKSTFSLGDEVRLFSPTLSVSFNRSRFTEPRWLEHDLAQSSSTQVEVQVADQHRLRELQKNLDEWLASSVSLLFFNNLRRLKIGGREIHWGGLGPGPVANSEWVALYEREDDAHLLIRSGAEAFPEDALQEIRQERMLGISDGMDFPPCSVDIVLGVEGRLFVVLPTGVVTQLPFACNAPFIQDPARLKIKDPETSPTNRWLLERSGRLAASAMITWLGSSNERLGDRASAYRLMPARASKAGAVENVCTALVDEAFVGTIGGEPILLTDGGDLVSPKKGVIVPPELAAVWPAATAVELLDEEKRPPLCADISASDRAKLVARDLVDQIDRDRLLEVLGKRALPKPDSWARLLNLWSYVSRDISGYRVLNPTQLRIVPVQRQDLLFSAQEVVRIGEKRLLHTEEDWDFVSQFVKVFNQNWGRFLAEQRRQCEKSLRPSDRVPVDAAYDILRRIGLEDANSADVVIDKVAGAFFARKEVTISDCVRLAQIAAKVGAAAGKAFRFVTEDRSVVPADRGVLVDATGKLEALLPAALRGKRLLHADYSSTFRSCSKEDWARWISSGYSQLETFVPLIESSSYSWDIDAELKKRGFRGQIDSRYISPSFRILDWDFEAAIWQHWRELSLEEPAVWGRIVALLLAEQSDFWAQKTSSRVIEIASNGHSRTAARNNILPAWILKLRELECLPDTSRRLRKPDQLLRRTPATEALLGIEPFIDGVLDREPLKPLFDLLGVRSKPTGPERIIECLRALAKAEEPPADEVEKWYRRLDQMLVELSTAQLKDIKRAFWTEKLVLTHDAQWAGAGSVFLGANEEEVPGAAIIRSSVRDLSLWRRIEIADQPTAEIAIRWLDGLPVSTPLPADDIRRLRSLLPRHARRVWGDCGHWLNLAGEWVPVDGLSYSLTMQSLTVRRHLHTWVKQQTADLQTLTVEQLREPPFSLLATLAGSLEERFEVNPATIGAPYVREWLKVFGEDLSRIELETQEETARVRALASRLASTEWRDAVNLQMIPYLEGRPAGTARGADVAWVEHTLFAEPIPKAKLARRVPEEIGKVIGRDEIQSALSYSFERSADDVRSYLAENFSLAEFVGEFVEREPTTTDGPANAVSGGTNMQSGAGAASFESSTPEPMGRADVSPNEANEEETVTRYRRRASERPRRPTLIEQFAALQGFQKRGDDIFCRADGAKLVRSDNLLFPWERRSEAGVIERFYFDVPTCLLTHPVEVEASVWSMLERLPALYSLIVPGVDGGVIEMTGAELCEMRSSDLLTIFPASYRLVHRRTT